MAPPQKKKFFETDYLMAFSLGKELMKTLSFGECFIPGNHAIASYPLVSLGVYAKKNASNPTQYFLLATSLSRSAYKL